MKQNQPGENVAVNEALVSCTAHYLSVREKPESLSSKDGATLESPAVLFILVFLIFLTQLLSVSGDSFTWAGCMLQTCKAE